MAVHRDFGVFEENGCGKGTFELKMCFFWPSKMIFGLKMGFWGERPYKGIFGLKIGFRRKWLCKGILG